MKRLIVALVLPAVALATLSSCVLTPPGALVTETREISDVEAVVLEAAGDVIITLGTTPSLSITAGANAQKRLTAEVVDGVLVLGTTPGVDFGLGKVKYELTVTSIQSVTIDGAGDVEADFAGADEIVVTVDGSGDMVGVNVDAKSVVTSIDGAGNVEFSGTTLEQSVSIDGSGNYDASELAAKNVTVTISGAGKVDVQASDTLDVGISGAGDVTYSGAAAVTQTSTGVGSVRLRD